MLVYLVTLRGTQIDLTAIVTSLEKAIDYLLKALFRDDELEGTQGLELEDDYSGWRLHQTSDTTWDFAPEDYEPRMWDFSVEAFTLDPTETP